jgi:hypothetical protein
MSPILSHSIATVPENVASLWIAADKGNAPRSDTLNRVGERFGGCDEKRTVAGTRSRPS